MGCHGITRQLCGIAVKDNGGIEEPRCQPARENECVSAVVARPRQDEHAR